MKVKIVQMKSFCGQFERNVDYMIKEIKQAKGYADVIIFPELCVSGSLIMDNFKRSDVIDELLKYNEEIIEASSQIMVIWGNVDRYKDELLDAGYVAYNGELVFKTSKKFNSTSNLEAKKEYFTHQHKNHMIGFTAFDKTCALVINNDIMVHDFEGYDIVFHLNSHYYRHNDTLTKKIDFIDKINTTVISCNGVGIINSGKHIAILDGQSLVSKDNKRYVLNPDFKGETQIVNLEDFHENVAPQQIRIFDALTCAIKQIDEEVFPFKPNWVVGLSGGLDSSVVAGLLTIALGKERVIGVNLASEYNSQTTKDNATHLAEKLGIEYDKLDIMPLVKATQDVLSQMHLEASGLAKENLQARVRAHVLMSIASIENGVVSNNTNKIESALGYGTLYGDTTGALGILGDCTKLDVIQLAHDINRYYKAEVIRTNLLPTMSDHGFIWEFAPSAELKEGQKDPMKWGYHDDMILRLLSDPNAVTNILNEYLNGELLESQVSIFMKDHQLDQPQKFIEDFLWVIETINRNTFKRIQGVPFIVLSNSAIGLDNHENQMPLVITEEMKSLMAQIKEMN